MFCKNCGTQLADADRFCPACGTAVEAQPEFTQEDAIPTTYLPTDETQPLAAQDAGSPWDAQAVQENAPIGETPVSPNAYQYMPDNSTVLTPEKKSTPKWLLPAILGGVAFLVVVGLLVFLLGGSGRLQDPEQIARAVVAAYIEDDYDTINKYAPFDVVEALHKDVIHEFGSEQSFYTMFNSNYDADVHSIQDALHFMHEDTVSEFKSHFGDDFRIILELNEHESFVLTRRSDILDELDSTYFEIIDLDTLDYIDVNQITELRYYYFDTYETGSRDYNDTWYAAYIAKIGNTWYVIDIY